LIDAKDLQAIAETVADNIVEIVEAMGLKPSKKAEGAAEARLPDETILQIYDTMPQEVKDFMRGHYGDEVWAEYEADIERIRGERSGLPTAT